MSTFHSIKCLIKYTFYNYVFYIYASEVHKIENDCLIRVFKVSVCSSRVFG